MKLTLGICLLGVTLVAAAPNNDGQHFYTNSYKHTDVRAYPLHRPGHNRVSDTATCAESADCSTSPRHTRMERVMKMKEEHYEQCVAKGECPRHREALSRQVCNNEGVAGAYACNKVDLMSFTPIADLGSTYDASDSWGWTDPETGDEIAIIGMMDGTAFVQITNPENPIVLGFLPQAGNIRRIWSDMKVFANHVFIIREVNHGMQIMDLTKLRQYYGQVSTDGVRRLTEDGNYREVTSSHNVVINEQTGFAYLVGTSTCSGGLHVVDISNPSNPRYAGCFSTDGYTHDAQCVIYGGPDTRYTGREICFAYNEDTVTIVDVSDKSDMKMLSRVGYLNAWYTHQGWITEDQRYMLANDELDEVETPSYQYTRTLLWDIQDLELPVLIGPHYASETSVDHNLYIKGQLAYLANYCSGLRILDVTQMVQGIAPEVAFFDAADYCNSVAFEGTWSNYPYFESGNIVVSSIELGLFVLKPQYEAIGLQ